MEELGKGCEGWTEILQARLENPNDIHQLNKLKQLYGGWIIHMGIETYLVAEELWEEMRKEVRNETEVGWGWKAGIAEQEEMYDQWVRHVCKMTKEGWKREKDGYSKGPPPLGLIDTSFPSAPMSNPASIPQRA